ncbi:MAG: DUF1801 domain-containing protein [Acinetobacter sp.]|nr:MAG: DUF1801 domain-containing protein [Acinetobacter sp.]
MEKKSIVNSYLENVSGDKKESVKLLIKIISQNIPLGFKEVESYGAIGYVIPYDVYPAGYHCNPKLPLPFINVAAQKNFVALYHMGLYADKELFDWFTTEYPKHSKYKLDMGKSCIRFKSIDHIPEELIANLCKKITPSDWIKTYEKIINKV